MKAKIIETGRIINVKRDLSKASCYNIGDSAIPDSISGFFIDDEGRTYTGYELDFNCTPINWEQRRYEIAKAVLQGIWSDAKIRGNGYDITQYEWYSSLAKKAVMQAKALIEELKESN